MKIKYSLGGCIYADDYLFYISIMNMKLFFLAFRTWKNIFFITRAIDMKIWSNMYLVLRSSVPNFECFWIYNKGVEAIFQ